MLPVQAQVPCLRAHPQRKDDFLKKREGRRSPSIPTTLFIPPLSLRTITLRHNHHTYTPRLRDHALDQALQRHALQPALALLDLRNLVHVLQADRAHRPRRAVAPHLDVLPGAGLAAGALGVVAGAGHVAGAADLVPLGRLDAGGGEEQRRGGRGAQLEVEGAVGADGDAGGDGGARVVVRGAGVEFLCSCGQLLPSFDLEKKKYRGWMGRDATSTDA